MSDNIERPVHQIVDKVFDSLGCLEKQLELIQEIIDREFKNQERSEENDT